jgi:hypothetical protein
LVSFDYSGSFIGSFKDQCEIPSYARDVSQPKFYLSNQRNISPYDTSIQLRPKAEHNRSESIQYRRRLITSIVVRPDVPLLLCLDTFIRRTCPVPCPSCGVLGHTVVADQHDRSDLLAGWLPWFGPTYPLGSVRRTPLIFGTEFTFSSTPVLGHVIC